MRSFDKWLSQFRDSISNYGYYVDFDKVYNNVDNIRVELNILNSLIGSQNIEEEFDKIVSRYPETLKCIPILLAVRSSEIFVFDKGDEIIYDFDTPNQTAEQYKAFLRETGLFNLMQNRIIHNLTDYVTGVETGLDSNARKNRGGVLMEDLVESYLITSGFERDISYFKEITTYEIEKRWNIDLSAISNQGKTNKRFDFCVKTENMVYAIETNFYTSSGSKLNETARSYKNIAIESKDIEGFAFVWLTDGKGWNYARHNLEETFDVMEHIYNISELENGIIERVFL